MTAEPDAPPEPRDEIALALSAFPVVGIMRGCPPDRVLPVARAAADGGLRVIEITMDSRDALRGIASLVEALPDLVVGAGTVQSAQDALAAIDAGAAFVVSPDTKDETLAACRSAGIPALPGAATPTEITRAMSLGAYAVKVFPAAQVGGPAFIRAVMAPLGAPRLVPTGGIDPTAATAYLRAGAFAVGIGGSVFSRDLMAAGDGSGIRTLVGRLRKDLS